MKKFSKVLVGCITWDRKEKYLERYIRRVKGLTYPNYDILLVDSSETENYYKKLKKIEGINVLKSEHIHAPPSYIENYHNALNRLREYFLMHSYEYLMSIEQDMLPPPNIIESLMFYNKPAVGVAYRMSDWQWCVYDYDIDKDEYDFDTYPPLIKQGKGLLKVGGCGMGCVLIKRELLEEFTFDGDKYHDTFFWGRIRKAGIPVYILTPMEIDHLKLEKKLIIKLFIRAKSIFKERCPTLFRLMKFILFRK